MPADPKPVKVQAKKQTQKRVYPRKCKGCGEKFTPWRPNQIVCSTRCGIKYANTPKQKQKRWKQRKD